MDAWVEPTPYGMVRTSRDAADVGSAQARRKLAGAGREGQGTASAPARRRPAEAGREGVTASASTRRNPAEGRNEGDRRDQGSRPMSRGVMMARMGSYADPKERTMRKRLFAAMLARGMDRHERAVAERKAQLFRSLEGRVLEIGPGTGVNLAHLGRNVRWLGVDPNPFMRPYLLEAAARSGVEVDFRLGRAEALPVDDQSVDAVIGSLVLCSVRDVADVLSEVLRVLRPGGRFVFLEHVRAPEGTATRLGQQLLTPFLHVCADGCRMDRDTAGFIRDAGFAEVQLERFDLPLYLAGPHIAGWAEKSRRASRG